MVDIDYAAALESFLHRGRDRELGLVTLQDQDSLSEETIRARRAKVGASCNGLNEFTTARVRDIEKIIALLIMRGSVNPDNLGRNALDFGMGCGAGAYVLQRYGGNVTGVDTTEIGVASAVSEGILPQERALVQDGFHYLSSLPPDSLNFISAFMMQGGFPHNTLCSQAERVLQKGGQLIINGGITELATELQTAVGHLGRMDKIYLPASTPGSVRGYCVFTYTKE